MRVRDKELREACQRARRRTGVVVVRGRIMGKVERDAETGAETLIVGCAGDKPPQRRTVRDWLDAMWGDFRPWPPESWEYSGNTVRIVAADPPAPDPPNGGGRDDTSPPPAGGESACPDTPEPGIEPSPPTGEVPE